LHPAFFHATLNSIFALLPADRFVVQYHEVLTVARQAKADAARAEAETAPLVRTSFVQRRPFAAPFSVLAAPLGGAAAAEGHGALNALDMDFQQLRF
jgi:hypothetical protein